MSWSGELGKKGPPSSCPRCGAMCIEWPVDEDVSRCRKCGWTNREYFPYLHRNSFNAFQGHYRSSRPEEKLLQPILFSLTQIGYVLCDILEVLEEIKNRK